MTTIEERASLDRTDELVVGIGEAIDRADLAAVEAQWVELAERVGWHPAALASALQVGPPPAFRLANGDVCYRAVAAGRIEAGNWVQAVHGDEHWHLVEHVTSSESAVGLAHDRVRLRWWDRADLVRVACRPDELAVRSEAAERRAEARADREAVR